MPSSLKPAEQCFRTSRLKRNRGNPTSSLRLASSFKRCKGDGAASIRSRFREELLEILVQSISRCRGSAVTSGGFGFRFGFLPEELLEEILLRLPVKSIVRFRSVCKRWRSLFTSRLFIDLYRSRIRCDPYSVAAVHSSTKKFLLDMAPELKDIGWSPLLLPNWGRVAWTFGPLNNGIYGVTFHLVEIPTGRSPILTAKIGFCNPATRDYRIIDPFPCQFHSLLSEAALKRPQLNFGFGSVPKENSTELDYKVVVLISYGEPFSSFLSFVYSLQSGEWKKLVDYERGKRQIGDVKSALDLQVPLVVSPQMFALKGRWHWLGRSQGNVQSFDVLSFNFADEGFKLLGGPTTYFDDYDVGISTNGELLVLQDHLAVMHFMFPQCLEVSVWMMMEYGVEESWTRIYKIQPNYYGRISRFVGIYPRPVRDEEKSGVIHIERLTFEDKDNNQTVVCDKNGYEIFSGCKSLSHIDWNVAGISTYMETLEPLS